MDRNWVKKISLMGSIWPKMVIIGENGQNCVILAYFGAQNDVICQKFAEIGQIIFSLKFSKNYLFQVYGHIFYQKCH